jgi:hypothetical protein
MSVSTPRTLLHEPRQQSPSRRINMVSYEHSIFWVKGNAMSVSTPWTLRFRAGHCVCFLNFDTVCPINVSYLFV